MNGVGLGVPPQQEFLGSWWLLNHWFAANKLDTVYARCADVSHACDTTRRVGL